MQNFHKGYEKNAQGVMKDLHNKDTSLKGYLYKRHK